MMHSDFCSREKLNWEKLIVCKRSNPRQLWSTLAGVLSHSAAPCFPAQPSFAANDYLHFITEKIASTCRCTAPFLLSYSSQSHQIEALLLGALHCLIQDSSLKFHKLDHFLQAFIIKEFIEEFFHLCFFV